MRTAALLILLACLSSPALAGKNANGALIVHTTDAVDYTTPICAQWEEHDPGTCENANTQTNKDENSPALIWLIASFCENSSPGVSVIYFGLRHNLPLGQGAFANFGMCAPDGSLEVPDAGWPDSGGNAVAFGSPVIGDKFFNFYFLNAYGFEGAFVGTGINPTGGYATFVDDSNPPIQDPVTQFGTVRWGEPGSNDCPSCEPPTGACCLPDWSCVFVLVSECGVLGGVFQGYFTDCDPNPCPQPEACCFDDEHCEDLLVDQCLARGGEPQGGGTDCGTADCRTPTGACCAPDGTCLVTPSDQCAGDFQGNGTDCEPDPCGPQACCFEDMHCEDLLEDDCSAHGGWPQGIGTVCTPELCVYEEPQACCFDDGSCNDLTLEDCLAAGGIPLGEGTTCAHMDCPPTATESRTWGRIKAGYR